MIITLTESEIALAYTVAGQRQAQNLAAGRRDRYGAGVGGFGLHVLGCLGEIALAKAFDRYWSGNVGGLKAADVGSLQIRSTDHPNGKLILHPADRDDDRYFLARVAGAAVDIVGYIVGRDGKQPAYWVEPSAWRPNIRPAYFVPTEALTKL